MKKTLKYFAPAATALMGMFTIEMGSAVAATGKMNTADDDASGWAGSALQALTPPKRVPEEVCGVEPRVSERWLVIGGGIPGNEDDARADVLHVYRRGDSRWEYDAALRAPTPQALDGFGSCAAIDGDTIAVGAPNRTLNGVGGAGCVFVFDRQGGVWRATAEVVAPKAEENTWFGSHVQIDAGTLVVGETRGARQRGGAENHGVYIFRRSAGQWAHEATITAPEELGAAQYAPGMAHEFGISFAFERDTLVVSAMGMNVVYVYERADDVWSMTQRIKGPTDPNDSKVGPGFGRTLDLENDVLVVAALRAGGRVPDAGAAFVFRREGRNWGQEAKLVAPDGETLNMFGHWVALDAGTILCGAFRAGDAGRKECGAGYLFEREGPDWVMRAKMMPPQEVPAFFTAYGVDLGWGTAVLSAGSAENPGAGFGVWVLQRGAIR